MVTVQRSRNVSHYHLASRCHYREHHGILVFPIWPKEEEAVTKTKAAANISGREQEAVEREENEQLFFWVDDFAD